MNQIKINYEYEVLLILLNKETHGRDLAEELRTSLTRIQSILHDLRQKNILDYRTQGKNHVYFIQKNLIAKSFILIAENYKLAKLFWKYPFLEPIMREACDKSTGMIILFGSYARFMPREESDIDLYISDAPVKDAIMRINHRISVKTGDFLKKDLLIQEIIKNHIIVQGGESFYDRVGFFKNT